MKPTEENIDNLISRWLEGISSPEENSQLMAWAESSPENQAMLENSRRIYIASSGHGTSGQFDVDVAWSKVRARLHEKPEPVIIPIGPTFVRFAAAASVILIAGFLLWLVLSNQGPEQIVIAANENIVNDTLTDGTVIALAPYTSLTFTEGKKERIANLSGEAYFRISEGEKQFVVQAGELRILDIGTSFFVDFDSLSGQTSVIVKEGIVSMELDKLPHLVLHAGETGLYDREKRTLTKSDRMDYESPTLLPKRKFEFRNHTLGEILSQINSAYFTNIQVSDPSLLNCKLTVRFENEELSMILAVLSETLGLELNETDEQIILEGEACNQ